MAKVLARALKNNKTPKALNLFSSKQSQYTNQLPAPRPPSTLAISAAPINLKSPSSQIERVVEKTVACKATHGSPNF